jgi:hypothetical protein
MATNPFDINVLAGVSFDGDQVGFVPEAGNQPNIPHDTGSGLVYGWYLWGYYGDQTGIGNRVLSLSATTDQFNGGISVSGTGAITVMSSQYVAGHWDNNHTNYTPPVFGVIAFANAGSFTWGNGNTYPNLYAIRGFGEDGRSIIVQKINQQTIQGTSISKDNINFNADNDLNIYMNGNAFVLSLDELTPFDTLGIAANVVLGTSYQFVSDASVISEFTDGVTTELAVCFAEGARIATPAGPVAVEDLVEGGLVLTASGAARPIKWIGQMLSRPATHPHPHEVQPVRVKAGAFGPGLPTQDLRLSPGHAIYVDGVLVPVGLLVNGATIVQEAVEQIRYFHVELDSHDVLLAEGLPCESYLDDGNRSIFANADGHAVLNGRLDPQSWDDACAPMVGAGPQLITIQQRLYDRAVELGWVRTEEAALTIEADGAVIAPLRVSGNRAWFRLPAAATLRLRSRAGVLAHVMPGLEDRRRLGVAVTELRLDGEALALDDVAFGQGFHPVEQHDGEGWRWTDGDASLGLSLAAPATIEVAFVMVAPSWIQPVPALRVAA